MVKKVIGQPLTQPSIWLLRWMGEIFSSRQDQKNSWPPQLSKQRGVVYFKEHIGHCTTNYRVACSRYQNNLHADNIDNILFPSRQPHYILMNIHSPFLSFWNMKHLWNSIKTIQCNLNLLTLKVTTFYLVIFLQRPLFNLLHKIIRFSDIMVVV